MKLTEIDLDNITKEIIKDTLFNVYRKNYSEADCLILFGCHLKPIIDERIKRAV